MPAAETKKKSPISSNRWILSYLLREKRVFIPSLIALLVTACLALAFPYFLKELVGSPVDSLRDAVPPAERRQQPSHAAKPPAADRHTPPTA